MSNVTKLVPKTHTEIINGTKVTYTYQPYDGTWSWYYEVRRVLPTVGQSTSLRNAKRDVRQRLMR